MANPGTPHSIPFTVRDCALITRAAGVRARTLGEFRKGVREVSPASIYYHFWGRLLRPRFDEPEYNNDLASWAWHDLHDRSLAERLSMAIPTDFDSTEALRGELLAIIDSRLEKGEPPAAPAERSFHFLEAQIVVFDTGISFDGPAELAPLISSLSTGSIYFHFIDARSRTPDRRNDLSAWLDGCGEDCGDLARQLDGLDPYFSSLKELRNRIDGAFQHFFGRS